MNEAVVRTVRIFDTTLRDGEQTPGVTLTPEEKLEIARQLDRLGVDVIEAGFPITSKGEIESIKLIKNAGLKAKICGLARVERGDIDAALQCGVDSIHVFLATSDIHLQHKLKIDREEALRRIADGVSYAKSHGVIVEFSAEDATRSDLDYLIRAFRTAVEAGADRLDIPDTVGVMTPGKMHELVSRLRKEFSVPLSVHCHDDFGLAVANSLAGIGAGAVQAHTTINGIGERAGNASMEEVVMALHCLEGYRTNINTRLIYETSRLVSRLTGIMVQPNKAIVGENAFGHESGIHTHGVLSHPLTYEPLEPELVGRIRWIQAGKHAGGHGISAQLESMGIKTTREQLREIVDTVKEIADKGKSITESDLSAIARTVVGQTSPEEKIITLNDLVVVTGTRAVPTASVKVELDGKVFVAAETGVGPVDAAVKALHKVTEKFSNTRLKEYRLEAITGGSDALGEVVVKVEDDKGNIASARATAEDIVLASVQAMVDGINKVLLKQRAAEPKMKQSTP